MKRLLLFATIVALSLVTSGALLAQSNSEVGAWKLNVAKSKYVGTPAPKSETATSSRQVDGIRESVQGVAADGSPVGYSFTVDYDGKDAPVFGVGTPSGEDTNSFTRVDENTVTTTAKKAGKVVRTSKRVVSEDGNVETITSKGTDDQGKPVSTTTVWEKQ